MDASDKQGYLGDLSKKTSIELNELLTRQGKILQNVKFVDKLPDKGERIKSFVEKINAELEARMDVDATADLFHQMALNAEKANRERGKVTSESLSDDEANVDRDPLKEIINRATGEKQITDNRDEKKPINSYEKIIKKSEKKLSPKKKFYPHKTVKAEHIEDISDGLDKMKFAVTKDIVLLDSPPMLESPVESSICEDKHSLNKNIKLTSNEACQNDSVKTNQDVQSNHTTEKSVGKTTLGLKSEYPNLKHRYDENLEMSPYGPSQKFVGAKLISIEESIGILETQKKKQEMLQAKNAGDRLAQRLGIKMLDFEPKFQEMRYRSQVDKDLGADSTDTDGEEVDYPD